MIVKVSRERKCQWFDRWRLPGALRRGGIGVRIETEGAQEPEMLLDMENRLLEREVEESLDGGFADQRKGDVVGNGAVVGVEVEAAAIHIL
ncbi:MAG: hypothetical protein NTX51_13585 [Verrucomicrobia bacterium]|nr:hypothetical protein [Verrucomicrobiota bacterium]